MNNTFPTHHTIPELIEKYGLSADNATLALQQYGAEQTAVVNKLLEVKQQAMLKTLRDLKEAQTNNELLNKQLQGMCEANTRLEEQLRMANEKLAGVDDALKRMDFTPIIRINQAKHVLYSTTNPIRDEINSLQKQYAELKQVYEEQEKRFDPVENENILQKAEITAKDATIENLERALNRIESVTSSCKTRTFSSIHTIAIEALKNKCYENRNITKSN